MPQHAAFHKGPHCLPNYGLQRSGLEGLIVSVSGHFNGDINNKVTFNTSHSSAPTERVFKYQMCILKGDYLNNDVLPVFSDKGDPDEMPHDAAFHRGPHCLPKFRLAAFRLRRINGSSISAF